jgi:uncharacterized protein (UPF0212 family)
MNSINNALRFFFENKYGAQYAALVFLTLSILVANASSIASAARVAARQATGQRV